jgi:hypothetical protein
VKRRYVAKRHRGTVRLWCESEWFDAQEQKQTSKREITPERSLKVRNHSPTGFEMGYLGSGCAQLALAILLDACDRCDALELYQDFKADIVSSSKAEGFEISEEAITAWAFDRHGRRLTQSEVKG